MRFVPIKSANGQTIGQHGYRVRSAIREGSPAIDHSERLLQASLIKMLFSFGPSSS
jgi:hypothetical protein